LLFLKNDINPGQSLKHELKDITIYAPD